MKAPSDEDLLKFDFIAVGYKLVFFNFLFLQNYTFKKAIVPSNREFSALLEYMFA